MFLDSSRNNDGVRRCMRAFDWASLRLRSEPALSQAEGMTGQMALSLEEERAVKYQRVHNKGAHMRPFV
jgi:hypothetical protein